MNKWVKTFAAAIVISQPTFALAEHWIPLGGGGNWKLDLDSVEKTGRPTAWISTSGQTAQGVLATYINIVAYCDQAILYIQDGELRSSWSSTVAPMLDLSETDRVIAIPATNAALNNAFDSLCKRR